MKSIQADNSMLLQNDAPQSLSRSGSSWYLRVAALALGAMLSPPLAGAADQVILSVWAKTISSGARLSNPQTVSWTQTDSARGASINVQLFNTTPQVVFASAFLTMKLGPGTGSNHLVAVSQFPVPATPAYVKIFSDLNLSPGSYYLTLVGPEGACWALVEQDVRVAVGPGVTRGISYVSFISESFPPASTFQDFSSHFQGQLTFDVLATIVAEAPSIHSPPFNQTNSIGTTAQFTVGATGTGPLAYQWRKDGTNLVSEGRISGATAVGLTIASLQPGDAGTYSVVVSNAHGSVTSSPPAALVVTDTLIAVNGTVTSGATFVNGPHAVSWTQSTPGLGVIITAPLFKTTQSPVVGTAFLTTQLGPGTDSTHLVATSHFTFPYETSDVVLFSGINLLSGTYFLTLVGPPNGAWGRALDPAVVLGVGVSRGMTYVSFTGNTFPPTSAFVDYSTQFMGELNFQVRAITVSDPPIIHTQPLSQTNTIGSLIQFMVIASGSGTLSYQWQKDGTNLVDGDGITGVTAANLTITSLHPSDSGNYSVVVSNPYGSVTSSPPASLTALQTILSVEGNADSGATLLDQAHAVSWTQSGGALGVTISAQLFKAVPSANLGKAYLTRKLGPGTSAADVVAMSDFTLPNSLSYVTLYSGLSLIPGTYYLTLVAPQGAWAGEANPFIVAGSGVAPGTNYLSFDSNVFPPASIFQDYNLILLGKLNYTVHATAVGEAPSVSGGPADQTNNIGTTVRFPATVTGTPPLSHQWFKDGTELTNGARFSGVTSSELTIVNLQVIDTGNYSLVVSNAYGRVESSGTALHVQYGLPWARLVASTINPNPDLTCGLSLDPQGNLYVTGWFDDGADFGGTTLTNSTGGGQDAFLAKYSVAGELQWVQRAGGATAGMDAGRGVSFDADGNVYVVGQFFSIANFGPIQVTSPSAGGCLFLAKYSSTGEALWVRQPAMPPLGHSVGVGIAVDTPGNSYVVGQFDGSTVSFGSTTLTNAAPGHPNSFLVKHDNAGVVQWAKALTSTREAKATGVALDRNMDLYVTGAFVADASMPGIDFRGSDHRDSFVAKFSSDGVPRWAKQIAGSGGVQALALRANTLGHVYVSGAFGATAGDTVSFAPSITLFHEGGDPPSPDDDAPYTDAFLAQYDSETGGIRWARRAGGAGTDVYAGVATDAEGNVYAAGGFMKGGDVDGVMVPIMDGWNVVATKYDSNGRVHWVENAASVGKAWAAATAVDLSGNCYVAGWFQSTVTFPETTLGGWNLFLARLNPPVEALLQFREFSRANGSVHIGLNGPPGATIVLESSHNLSIWTPWRTNTLAAEGLSLSAPMEEDRQFFRARLMKAP